MSDCKDFAEGDQLENFGFDQFIQDGEMTDMTGEGAVDSSEGQMQTETPCEDEEDKKLFIGGISWDTEAKDLREYFSQFGEVTDVNIKTDPHTGKSRGFAFITFGTEDTIDKVLAHGIHSIKGKQVDPKRARVRPGVKKIFVGGLDTDLSESDIKEFFEKFGKIENIELPFDKTKNQRRQFCFITFESQAAVEEVCKQQKIKIGNKECDVKKATPKPDPRSMRSGFGGYGPWGRGGYSQGPYWGGPGYGYGSYGSGYGGYGSYDYGGYGGYGGGYSSYDYSGWGYGQGYGGELGQQQSTYGKTRRGGGSQNYHPYTR